MEPVTFRVPLAQAGASVGARLYDVADAAAPTLVLAHGAGAPQAHPFMLSAARGLASRGVRVVTFDFPYMEARRKVPDRAPVLEACWKDVLVEVRRRVADPRVCIGGKSMGGRMATHVAALHPDAGPLAGVVLLGYPLHPPGRPDQRRDAHLPRIAVPTLFVQGTRDAFGTPDELRAAIAPMGALATLHEIAEGDHSFAVPRAAGRSTRDVLEGAWDVVAEWVGAR